MELEKPMLRKASNLTTALAGRTQKEPGLARRPGPKTGLRSF